jgi:sensor histidine kinase YesM
MAFEINAFVIRTRKVFVIRVWKFFTDMVLKILFKEVNFLVEDPFRKLITHSLGKNPSEASTNSASQ